MTYPVDVRRVPEEQKPIYRQLAASGVNMVYYPDSIEGTCEDCGTAVYVGPAQQERLRQEPGGFSVLCAYCASKAIAVSGAGYDFEPAGKEANPHGIPRVFVNPVESGQGYLVSCVGCGRKARLSQPPGRKVVLCPDCLRRQSRG